MFVYDRRKYADLSGHRETQDRGIARERGQRDGVWAVCGTGSR